MLHDLFGYRIKYHMLKEEINLLNKIYKYKNSLFQIVRIQRLESIHTPRHRNSNLCKLTFMNLQSKKIRTKIIEFSEVSSRAYIEYKINHIEIIEGYSIEEIRGMLPLLIPSDGLKSDQIDKIKISYNEDREIVFFVDMKNSCIYYETDGNNSSQEKKLYFYIDSFYRKSESAAIFSQEMLKVFNETIRPPLLPIAL